MKKLVALILLAAMLFTAGCVGDYLNAPVSPVKSDVIEVTQLEQINASIQKSPVFLRIGSGWCPLCRAMTPVLEKMAAEYKGNATIAAIDTYKSPDLKEYFGIKFIPDSCVIVGINNGTYVYMQENGTVSTDRFQARFIGLNKTTSPNEETFKKVLNLAIRQKEQDKPNK